jgi:hypothetical protein
VVVTIHLRIRVILREETADSEANSPFLRQNSFCRDTRSTDRVDRQQASEAFRSGSNQGEDRRRSQRNRRNARQGSNQGEDPRAGRQGLAQCGGAARGSDSRGASPGDGEKGQIRRWGSPGSDLSPFSAHLTKDAHSGVEPDGRGQTGQVPVVQGRDLQ